MYQFMYGVEDWRSYVIVNKADIPSVTNVKVEILSVNFGPQTRKVRVTSINWHM